MIRYSIYYLLKTLVNQITTMYLVSFLEAMENAKTTFVIRAVHRGAFCQFLFRWIYYCHSSKSTGKETGKTYLCAVHWTWHWLTKQTKHWLCRYYVVHLCRNSQTYLGNITVLNLGKESYFNYVSIFLPIFYHTIN